VHDRLAELAAPRPGDVVVDLGCGRGGTLAALASRHASLRLFGVDLNAQRLVEAAERVGATATVMVRADLTRPLPLRNGCADVVVCHNVTELLADPAWLLAEAVRVLRNGGRAVLSHTDFAGLVVHGADPVLTGRIVAAYASVAQPWMGHIDPYAARGLPGLATAAGLVVERVDGHVLAAHRLNGAGRPRLDEVAAAVRGHIRRGLVDLITAEVNSWWDQLTAADARSEFCFAETALITIAHRP
jgi:SAM-dependent methyltransferase